MQIQAPQALSVGSITKKVLAINPDLTAPQLIGIIRDSIKPQAQPELAGEFASLEIIDEERALRLARETVRS